MIQVTIDNKQIDVPDHYTVLDAAKALHVNIPTLCYHPDQSIKANCRICMVQDKRGKMIPACSTKVCKGMEIATNTKFVREMQKGVLELILANHDQDCLKCVRNGKCELQDLCERFNISKNSFEENQLSTHRVDDSNPALVRDYSKCIKCGRCVEVCSVTQNVNVLARAHRSTSYEILPVFDKPIGETECVFCGQCIKVCPVGAIYEKNDTEEVLEALEDETLHVIVQIAPAVRVSIGEEFGLPPGAITTGKIVASLKRLGFDRVFDTNFTADVTILEEGNEFIDRLTNEGVLPMITSCSPGWINYIEGFAPELIDHLSTCKSPQQMFGALSKTYYADKEALHPSTIHTVSIMPCTAKKYEANRSEMSSYGYIDVDTVLTTRELAQLIRSAGIDFEHIEEEAFDTSFGITTGAGAIFGATGGVMEAALRTVHEVLTGETLNDINFNAIRGLEGRKEAEIEISGQKIKVAVVHGLRNASEILEEIKNGTSDYAFVEVMACPGGCIGGGGQPIEKTRNTKELRVEAIYKVDEVMTLRKSHQNPAVKQLYDEFLGKPLGERSHHLLHTHYKARFEQK